MNVDMISDIQKMLTHYGFKSDQLTHERLNFRLQLLQEECQETMTAFESSNEREVVDGLIDIIVVALGTLELSGININKAWSEVHRANMTKVRGVKPGRHSDGWDLYKPLNWQEPDHLHNTGNLKNILKGKTQ